MLILVGGGGGGEGIPAINKKDRNFQLFYDLVNSVSPVT